jgi:hypothetical protein
VPSAEARAQHNVAVVAAGLTERVNHTRELIRLARQVHEELGRLKAIAPRDPAVAGHCSALEAREVEIRNELRKMQSRPEVDTSLKPTAGTQHGQRTAVFLIH